MSESMPPEPEQSNNLFGRLRRFFFQASDRALLGLFIIIVSGGLLICIATAYFAGWLQTDSNEPQTQTSVAVAEPPIVSPLPTNSDGSIGIDRPLSVESSTTITMEIGSGQSNVQIPPPLQIEVGGQIVPISVNTITANELLIGRVYEDVRWVQNSIVNYAFQLPNTAVYQDLLQTAQPGDTIALYGAFGDVKTYIIEAAVQAAPTENTLWQDTPAITLILASDPAWIVRGRFALAEDELAAGAQTAVSLGETAVIGDATLTAKQAIQMPDSSNVPAGYLLYQVEYELSNIGSSPLDTGWFNLVLVDDSGNQYHNLQATAVSRILEAGQSAQQTAAYQIPVTLATTGFNLAVSRIDGPATLNVSLPYTAPAAPTTQISLLDAQLSDDGARLLLTGEIVNLGAQSLTVQPADILLQSQGQPYLIFETVPQLPWVIQPGSSQSFFLNTQRPPTAEAVVRVFNQEFALQNLR